MEIHGMFFVIALSIQYFLVLLVMIIEKLTIKDVVEYKDKMIALTKKIFE